jgi:hypothetical protein
MEEELFLARDMEKGMTYVRIVDKNSNYIFTYDSPGKSNGNVKYSALMSSSSSTFRKGDDITVNGYPVRKARVNEEVWLEECIKADKWISEPEAMSNFLKRFDNSADKKKFRIGYVDKEGKNRSKVVTANTMEDALLEIPELETVTYSVDA